MGRNFYHHVPDEKPRHIGKLSGGWVFQFRGYDDPPLLSWADWRAHLAKTGGQIRDGYDELHTLERFTRFVETRTATARNFADCVREDYPEMKDDVWKDAEGFPFCYSEFC